MRLLVPETLCHVQRCPRPGPERVVGINGFRTIAGRPRDAENPSRPARPPHARRLQATLTCKAKLIPASLERIARRFGGGSPPSRPETPVDGSGSAATRLRT